MTVNTKTKTALNKEAGAQQSTENREPIRESFLSFRMDNISSTLGTRQVYDEIAGEYAPAEPQFFMKVGTVSIHFVREPLRSMYVNTEVVSTSK